MKSAVSIDSLVFDLDGTLVDSLPGIEYSVLRALELCNAPVVRADFRALIGPPIRNILAAVSGRSLPEELDQLESAFRGVYDGGAWQRATLYPQVRETLDSLSQSGIRLFVVTNKPRVPAGRILEHLQILPLLTAYYSPDQQQPAYKTKAQALAKLREDWALDADHMLLVGDSQDDAHAAAHCGCQFAGVEFGYGTACSQSEYPVHLKLRSFGELLSAL